MNGGRGRAKVNCRKTNLTREKKLEKAVGNKYPYYLVTLSTVCRFETLVSELVTQLLKNLIHTRYPLFVMIYEIKDSLYKQIISLMHGENTAKSKEDITKEIETTAGWVKLDNKAVETKKTRTTLGLSLQDLATELSHVTIAWIILVSKYGGILNICSIPVLCNTDIY